MTVPHAQDDSPQFSDKEIGETLAAAKVKAIDPKHGWPYVATALFSMHPVRSPGLGTFASDRQWRLYYDPDWMMQHTVDEISGLLLHEVSHCLRGHGDRFAQLDEPQNRQPLMNIAADVLINEDLQDASITLPEGGMNIDVLKSTFDIDATTDMITEELYWMLVDAAQPPCTCGGDTDDDTGDGDTDADTAAGGGNGDAGDDDADGAGGGGSAERCPRCNPVSNCGSGAHGFPQDYEQQYGADGAPKVSPDQAENIRQRVAQAILDHAKEQGSVPGGWERWAENRMQPVVDWRKELSARVRRQVAYIMGRTDYSFTAMNRRNPALRSYGQPVILPGMREPEPPRVAVVIDTSGSMSEEELCYAITETHGVLKALGAVGREITLISCDADAEVQQHVRRLGGTTELGAGGGGTDMRVGIAAALDQYPSPEIVIVLTDGYTPWPDRDDLPQSVHLIVGLTVPDQHDNVPSWASTVIINPHVSKAVHHGL